MRIKRRVQKLEQAQKHSTGAVTINTDGAEYGLEAVAGDWVVFVQEGTPVKALPKALWEAWDV